jgi:TolB protein
MTRLLVLVLATPGILASAVSLGATLAGAASVPGEIAYPGNGNIYLINANGTDQRVLISGGSKFRVDHWGGIAWSRDATQIAFTVGNHRAGDRYGDTLRLYVAAADGTNVRPLSGAPQGSFAPTWSPDNSLIAFSIRGKDETSIAVIGVDGTGLRKLASSTDPQDFYWAPDWSTDGAWILFESNPIDGLRSRLMAVRPDGTGLHQLVTLDTSNHCICADWSPDGNRIAYQAPGTPPRYDYPDIWVMNADGSGRIQLTRNRARDENPDWSPDGKRIAFYSERAGNAEIYWIPAAGGQARRVTHDPWYNGAPRWRPTG